MKLKKIAALCNQAGMFYLQNRRTENGTEQWLGDGKATYLISGLPYMDLDNVCAMFDIPEKKREKLFLREVEAPDYINWDDTDPAERELCDSMLHLRFEGRELLPLRTSAGVVFIQQKYLTPLDDLGYMHLYERRDKDNCVYIVAKIGMLVQAVIMPVDVVCEDLIDALAELTALCHDALRVKNRKREKQTLSVLDSDQGSLFRVDADTGEVVERGEDE